ncbi:g1103 [Coccomyxa elongata]
MDVHSLLVETLQHIGSFLPFAESLEASSIEELDGLRNHGPTLQALSSMTKLRSIRVTLGEGFLRTWPDLARLHRLEALDLRGCPSYGQPWAAWAPIPGWMTQLASLRNLSLTCAGQLPAEQQLPCGFGRLTNLKFLSVGTWSGSFLPEEICALTDLEELSWRGALPCDVVGKYGDDYTDDYNGAPDQAQRPFTLPKEFRRLKKLRVLKLDCHIAMTELPPRVPGPEPESEPRAGGFEQRAADSLANLGTLSLAKLDDCAWLEFLLPALTFLESSSRRRRRRRQSAGNAQVFRVEMSSSCQAAVELSGRDGGTNDSICVLERQTQGCPRGGCFAA